ncbi:MAG: hypothetical protein KAU50_08915, partial [Candidatus Marinimicrobia bacterium]|nr:hypothetical protein [Candidatus Neomarinimicrobiota bacterium]
MRTLIHSALGLLLTGSLVQAQDERMILTVDEPLAEHVEQLDIKIEFGFGEIILERGNPAKAVTGFIQYDEEYIRPFIKYIDDGSTARFKLATKSRHDSWGIGGVRKDMDSPESELYFTTSVPLEIDFSCGLGEAHLDLGHLQVKELSMDNGLGETTLDFSTLNGAILRYVSVDNGLGELQARRLSNARTKKLSVDCGLGSADLDFSGEEYADMEVDINVGLGSVTLKIPKGYNVEL